ncbi:hypothetical protein G6O67_002307 [Ophiocordyceps sinensis]|uniref:Anaphase-promoting complex subunit 4 n=1 Tax=Ophiocordyceps sinensis TaxID=72228 RepID=A0A8H4PTZ1_9HYPO|nr:hypothetical protein G6O67_002307 [Ophiocordyceps sinensis]
MDQARRLSLFSDSELGSRAPPGFPVGCPTLDVMTTWDSGSKSLFIYRPPGQVVSKIHQVTAPGEAAPETVAVTWKPDGQFLAVGWSDGVVRLMGLENNKAAHHIPVCQKSETSITHIGWASSTISNKTCKLTSGRLADSVPDGWAHEGDQLPVNLPQRLTFLDVDTALPKISPLPTSSAGADEDATVFTLRTGIDFLFQQSRPDEYDKVNVMVVGTSDGKLQLSVHDSFIVGSFQCPAVGLSASCQTVRHASHPNVSTHVLVLADKTIEPDELHLLPMDLPFLSSSPVSLSLLTSKLTTLQKLLRYLKQTQLHMLVEWKNARELPSRFLRSVEGDLDAMQSGPRGIVPALYHTVVTGHAYRPVREWLVDSIAERGHKRWDKAVVSGLENLRSLVHENFLPALERCAIILSRLRGLAQFYDNGDDVGFSVMQISRVLDIIGCLILVGHKVLTHVMAELDHFRAFSVWLRFQIDRQATSARRELGEKEATMDNSKVLTYIEKYLTASPLGVYLDDISREDCSADWDHCEDGPSLLQMLDRQLQRREEGQPSMKALPQVDFLVNYMTSWCNRIFRGIAESKKRSVRFGAPVRLSVGRPTSHMDVKVCEAEKGGTIFTAVAFKGDESKLYVFRAGIDIVNGISANQPATSCCVDLGDRKLVDLKFLNDKSLVVLCNEPDHVLVVVSIPVQSAKLDYTPLSVYGPGGTGSVTILISTHGFAEYRLPVQQAVRPVKMEVHDRSDTFSIPHEDP